MNSKPAPSLKGILSLFVAGFLFSLYGVFSRYIATDFALFYQTTSRYCISVFILFLIGSIFHLFKPIRHEDRKWFIIQALLITGINIPYYLAVVYLPLGTALFLFYASSVVFSYLFGFFFLQEKLDRIKILSLILSMLGIFFIYQGNFVFIASGFLLTAILAGGFFGLYTSSSKKINLKYSSVQINLVSYVITIILTAPFIIARKENIFLDFSAFSWHVNFIYALAVVATGFFIVYGFKYIEAQKGSLILLSELLFVVANGFLFFHEVPNSSVLLGGVLILIALISPNINFSRGFLREKLLLFKLKGIV